jgi:hypothetical protein
MSSRLRWLAKGIAAAAVAMLVGAGSASAATISETSYFVFPQSFTIVNPCTGDALQFSGEFVAVTQCHGGLRRGP